MCPMEYLHAHADKLGVSNICADVLGDPRFPVWSGSAHPIHHHYGNGGLAKHTAEVARICECVLLAVPKPLDKRLVFIAAVYHDVGKLWDYENPPDAPGLWRATSHKRLIGHLSKSVAVWDSACSELDLLPDCAWLAVDEQQAIRHAILAHHGSREAGSPVGPKTALAWLLHGSDMLSARLDDCDRFDPFAG